jgi:hypothetical protein
MNDVATPLILWQDDDVYINGTYPVDPPTIGVATFDGLARTGYPYDFPNYTAYGRADHLTSVPIDLEYPASDSIYLSFFYQAKGLERRFDPAQIGTACCSNSMHRWNSRGTRCGASLMWITHLSSRSSSRSARAFLERGFQFRFVNYATLERFVRSLARGLCAPRCAACFQRYTLGGRGVHVSGSEHPTDLHLGALRAFQEASSTAMALQVQEKLRNLDINDRFIPTA